MDYSGRVNSKQGSGGVADAQETNVHTRNRIKELLATQVLDLDNDPYVFRNHLGLLECRLCLTTHVSEASYISHLSGKKHLLNLQKRKLLDEKLTSKSASPSISLSNTPKRRWNKIGKPAYQMTKIRNPTTLQLGLLISIKYPNITQEPLFRFMNWFELTKENQDKFNNGKDFQYLVIYGEPYENLCVAIPEGEIDKSEDMSEDYWWYWDTDSKEFYLQFLYKKVAENDH